MTITPASMTGFARIEGSTDTLAGCGKCAASTAKVWMYACERRTLSKVPNRSSAKPLVNVLSAVPLQVSLNVERTTLASAGRIDHTALNALLADIAKIEIPPDAPVGPATLDGILQLRGIIVADEGGAADDGANTVPLADIPALLDALDTARRDEGARLTTALRDILDRIESLAADAAELADRQPPALAERYRAALTALIADNAAVPEDRIIQEAAALAVKADVAEELERLKAHVAQARDLLASPEAAGRRLDFLAQEFNREANTLAAKSADIALTRVAMELKAAIDALKEQAQNIE